MNILRSPNISNQHLSSCAVQVFLSAHSLDLPIKAEHPLEIHEDQFAKANQKHGQSRNIDTKILQPIQREAKEKNSCYAPFGALSSFLCSFLLFILSLLSFVLHFLPIILHKLYSICLPLKREEEEKVTPRNQSTNINITRKK